ncbi:hypothetical protein [Streptosporangium sp. NPDC049078]|uniref:hypothetical protein n=1 Tax=Streptosporangium sp. NPDC049078 TaxID=3155767 RepID=UPI0034482694
MTRHGLNPGPSGQGARQFNVNPGVVAARAFEVPNKPGVRLHNMVTVSLGGVGTIRNVVNTTGGPSNSSTNVANLVDYP